MVYYVISYRVILKYAILYYQELSSMLSRKADANELRCAAAVAIIIIIIIVVLILILTMPIILLLLIIMIIQ